MVKKLDRFVSKIDKACHSPSTPMLLGELELSSRYAFMQLYVDGACNISLETLSLANKFQAFQEKSFYACSEKFCICMAQFKDVNAFERGMNVENVTDYNDIINDRVNFCLSLIADEIEDESMACRPIDCEDEIGRAVYLATPPNYYVVSNLWAGEILKIREQIFRREGEEYPNVLTILWLAE
jgi:hypothetical protein